MGQYRIVSTTSVKFGKYQDVLRVIAKKEMKKGFFAKLFTSPKGDTHLILSKDSPLASNVLSRTPDVLWDIDESMFRPSALHGTTYLVELDLDRYESAKTRRMENERRERELKAQKEREEREAADRKRKAAEEERRIKDALENATIQEIPLSHLQMVVDENDSFSGQMAAIAGNANLSFLTRNDKGFQNSIIELYNRVHGYNSHKLKTVAAKDCQCIGLAFVKMAMYVSNGDIQVNEIAAQNAFYCIVKDYRHSGNTYALPALFSLLQKKPQTLEDELYRANADPQLVGMDSLLPSAPYRRQERAMSNRLPILKFLLQKFYDEEEGKFTIDTTLPYHIPSVADVAKFIREYNQSEFVSMNNSVSIGEQYLNAVYEDIEDQLNL